MDYIQRVLLEVLLIQLVNQTPYLNSVRELMNIIQRPKALIDEDCMSKFLTYYPLLQRGFKPTISRVKLKILN